jgi:methylenetetrahydrofolate dehydrogenase (NADP+)/methenyltetrahydrofolate cyclohydrolase
MVVNGGELAKKIRDNVKSKVAEIKKRGGEINFAVVLVGNNPASKLYIEKKQSACEEAGINFKLHRLPAQTTQEELNERLDHLSWAAKTDAILLQLPLPKHLNANAAIAHINPLKDVDGLTTANFGKLAQGSPAFVPCTALGIMHILIANKINLVGANAVIIGRSNIVGKPISYLLSNEHATVTIAHSKTKNLIDHTKNADIIIVAAGVPNLLRGNMVKSGATIIDVGINRDGNNITGDVNFDEVAKIAGLITPVPNGVGPLTIAFLLSNIIQAYNIAEVENV